MTNPLSFFDETMGYDDDNTVLLDPPVPLVVWNTPSGKIVGHGDPANPPAYVVNKLIDTGTAGQPFTIFGFNGYLVLAAAAGLLIYASSK